MSFFAAKIPPLATLIMNRNSNLRFLYHSSREDQENIMEKLSIHRCLEQVGRLNICKSMSNRISSYKPKQRKVVSTQQGKKKIDWNLQWKIIFYVNLEKASLSFKRTFPTSLWIKMCECILKV